MKTKKSHSGNTVCVPMCGHGTSKGARHSKPTVSVLETKSLQTANFSPCYPKLNFLATCRVGNTERRHTWRVCNVEQLMNCWIWISYKITYEFPLYIETAKCNATTQWLVHIINIIIIVSDPWRREEVDTFASVWVVVSVKKCEAMEVREVPHAERSCRLTEYIALLD